jgi:hypothetical protein
MHRFCQLLGAKEPDPCLVGPWLHSRPVTLSYVTLSAAKGLGVPCIDLPGQPDPSLRSG